MLRHLRVTNFAILSDVSIDLGPGMNVLTGETGAGKSLIVDAVNLLRGGRASADIPRTGSKQAIVEAVFEIPEFLKETVDSILKESGIDQEDELLVRRVIQKGGRSRTYINGALTTATVLAQLGGYLVDLSGQHQHQGLTDPKEHRQILDAFSGNQKLASDVAEHWKDIQAIESNIVELTQRGQHEDMIELAEFQLSELLDADLKQGEEDEIRSIHSKVAKADQISETCEELDNLLYHSEKSAIELLDQAARKMSSLEGVSPEVKTWKEEIAGARATIDEVARSLREFGQGVENNPKQLEELEQRLSVLNGLSKKYGGSVESAIQKRDTLASDLKSWHEKDGLIEAAEEKLKLARAKALASAQKLHKARTKGAKKLSSAVQTYLDELGMQHSRIVVEVKANEDSLGAFGIDTIEVQFAPNQGEDAKPLAKIASGGELSRIMLAIKLVLKKAEKVGTYVFDEVDTGIGGATAEVVGQQIRLVANQRQVLCVTHLAQIAAFCDHHFYVEKESAKGRTETRVKELKASERKSEIARMLAGVKVTKQAKAHAKELLDLAKDLKDKHPPSHLN